MAGGCVVVLFAPPEIGAPQPPEMSFGVIREGTLPNSILDAAGLDVVAAAAVVVVVAAGVAHAFASDEPHGSNMFAAAAVIAAGCEGANAGAGFDAVVVGEERLKAELKAGGLCIGGEGIFVAIGCATDAAARGGEAVENPPKASSASMSALNEVVVGLGGEAGVAACVKEKSSMLPVAAGMAAGFGAGGFVAVGEKKFPPLRGGGGADVICAATGVDLIGIAAGKFSPDNALEPARLCVDAVVPVLKLNAADDDCDCAGAAGEEKFSPPKASANPPNASCFCGCAAVMPPKDGCRLC